MSEKVINLEEIETLLDIAQEASRKFAGYTRNQVKQIVEAVTAAAVERAAYYAEWAVRETGYGVVEDKVIKNHAGSAMLVDHHKDVDYCGYQIDHEKKLIKFARPAGVVLSLVPSTNPVASTYFSVLSCLLTRNAVIMCPHPAAKECSVDSSDYLAEAAIAAGAPEGVIQVVRNPSIPLLGEMIKHEKVNLILATGGPAVVRASYSSGNPAIGVGPGNVAHYVDGTFDMQKAAEDIAISASFDNNLPCTCDSVVLAEVNIAEELLGHMGDVGVQFVTDPGDVEKLRQFLFPEGAYNPEAIGKPAKWIAEQVGLDVAEFTRSLCVEIQKIDYKGEEFSREKLFPVIGFMRVNGFAEAYVAAEKMIQMGGLGHSAAIHTNNPDTVLAWSSLPVYRIAVNGPAFMVSVGAASALPPTFTLGTGFFGRSSVCENVGPNHLVHWTSVAYNSDMTIEMGDIDGALQRWDEKH